MPSYPQATKVCPQNDIPAGIQTMEETPCPRKASHKDFLWFCPLLFSILFKFQLAGNHLLVVSEEAALCAQITDPLNASSAFRIPVAPIV
jgi:hypothetical protein